MSRKTISYELQNSVTVTLGYKIRTSHVFGVVVSIIVPNVVGSRVKTVVSSGKGMNVVSKGDSSVVSKEDAGEVLGGTFSSTLSGRGFGYGASSFSHGSVSAVTTKFSLIKKLGETKRIMFCSKC